VSGVLHLTRPSAGGELAYVAPGGEVEATVLEQRFPAGEGEGLVGALLDHDSLVHLNERYTVVDQSGACVFYVERYRAASAPAFTVYDSDGQPLAVYLSDELIVRDGTSAPVATFNDHELVELDGTVLAKCARMPLFVQWLVDDEWTLGVGAEPKVLDRRAVIAFPLICRLLWSKNVPRERTKADLAP
jgi:hypothetical protein